MSRPASRGARLLIVAQLLGCGDRSPPALWPEPPPPTLARPLGIDTEKAAPSDAQVAATGPDLAEPVDPDAEGEAKAPEPAAQPDAPEAKAAAPTEPAAAEPAPPVKPKPKRKPAD